jgi:hypothetical protein
MSIIVGVSSQIVRGFDQGRFDHVAEFLGEVSRCGRHDGSAAAKTRFAEIIERDGDAEPSKFSDGVQR